MPVPWLRWSFAVDRKLRQLHAERPFDLIVFPDAYAEGFRFSLAPCIPFVVRFGGPASVVQRWDGRVLNRVRARFESWLERVPALRAPILLCASRAFADQISSEWGLDAARFRIVRNPLNLDRFRPAEPGETKPGERVLFVGHIQPLKGLHELVAAVPMVASRHPGVRFQIVGNDTRTGPDRTSLRHALEQALRAQGALDRVQFRDPLPQSDLPPLYQDCSVFVLPSHHDVYPNAALEAMGCGRPIVVTSTAGVAELVTESRCGIVVPPDDARALAAALSDILAMPASMRDEMGARGRRLVEQVCATPVHRRAGRRGLPRGDRPVPLAVSAGIRSDGMSTATQAPGSPLIDVILPAYNGSRVIRKALDSALAQQVPLRIIVVDDGSSDDSAAIARSYGPQGHRDHPGESRCVGRTEHRRSRPRGHPTSRCWTRTTSGSPESSRASSS